MTGKKFAAFIRKQTDTDSTTFDDAEMVLYMNIIKDDMCKDFAQTNENIFGMVAFRNLIKDQREYSIPEYLLNNSDYFEIDIKGDGHYRKMNEFDLHQYGRPTTEQAIRNILGYRPAEFMIFRNGFWVYSTEPIIDVPDGLKLHYIRYPDDYVEANLSDNLTDLSNDLVRPRSAGIPRQLHLVWATKVIVMYKTSKDRQIALTQTEQNVEFDYQKAFKATTGMNLDRVHRATVPTHDFGMNY